MIKEMAFIRKYKTASGATGVQVCYKKYGEIIKIEHIGSAKSEKTLIKLLQKAQSKIDKNQNSLFDLKKYDINKKEKTENT